MQRGSSYLTATKIWIGFEIMTIFINGLKWKNITNQVTKQSKKIKYNCFSVNNKTKYFSWQSDFSKDNLMIYLWNVAVRIEHACFILDMLLIAYSMW